MSASTSYPALRITALSKTYKRSAQDTPALDCISLDIAQGEFFGLLGPNGAGKSTLINALGSLIKPDHGTIEILGRRIDQNPHFCRMAIGIVPQEITVDPFFTVREILTQQSGYYGLRHNDEWIETLIERLGLHEKTDARVSRLSGGMKRRVLIAQALVHRAPIIVLDEPTAGVDIELRHRIWEFMRELNGLGHTIVLTTHYLEEAQTLCSRIALLNRGKIAAIDNTKQLLSQFSGNRLQFKILSGTIPSSNLHQFSAEQNGLWSVSYRDATELTDILSALRQSNTQIEIVQVGQANLEEVFLRLTHSN